jgi:hypothetical protein
MPYPPLVYYRSISDYRQHFENIYCQGPITTFDGISVRFRKADFDHAFYESVNAKDDTFSQDRAERMDWIKAALEDANAALYVGWNKNKKRIDYNRRVALVNGNYVVIIFVYGNMKGAFITAYIVNKPGALQLIQKKPPWP